MLKDVEWGDFKFNDGMFEVCRIKNKLSKADLEPEGKIPVYSSESTNNGIIGYTNIVADFTLNKKNQMYLVFGDHTRSFNIATEDFNVADNVKVLRVSSHISIKALLFICSAWKKCIFNKGYARHWSIAKDVSFKLPIKNKTIDFDFMERFMEELEADRNSILDTYLSTTGLKDYKLTVEEQRVLDDYHLLQFEEFRVVDIFTVKNSGNILSRDIVDNSGDIPYLCASRENNSVSSYISHNMKCLDEGNCVFIGGKTFVVTYQENDFFSNDSHNLILYIKDKEKRNKLDQLYLATCIDKSLKHKYSWGDSISNSKIQKDVVSLPAKNNQPDLSTAAVLISAMQKMIIKDVVQYTEQKSALCKSIIEAA